MNITIFGATGDLGSECLEQSLEAGHNVTVLVRNAEKLPEHLRKQISVIEGNALVFEDVKKALSTNTEAIVFAIGVDQYSPENLCTDITRHILKLMREMNIPRFIWCGGGSTFVEEDKLTFGARFVRWFSEMFLALRHFDKEQQYKLLQENKDLNWIGIRPLQMKAGPKKGEYRLGFNTFSGLSKISFADCAHAMINMLTDDKWMRKAPIIQY